MSIKLYPLVTFLYSCLRSFKVSSGNSINESCKQSAKYSRSHKLNILHFYHQDEND